jgi:hypothetical protein
MRRQISTTVSMIAIASFTCLASIFSTSVFAIGTTQCRSVGKTDQGIIELERVEKEIWGRNIVEWYHRGELVDPSLIKIDEISKNILSQSRLEDEVLGERLVIEYEVNVTLVDELESDQATRFPMLCVAEEFPQIID